MQSDTKIIRWVIKPMHKNQIENGDSSFMTRLPDYSISVSVSISLSCGFKEDAQVGRKNLLSVFFKWAPEGFFPWPLLFTLALQVSSKIDPLPSLLTSQVLSLYSHALVLHHKWQKNWSDLPQIAELKGPESSLAHKGCERLNMPRGSVLIHQEDGWCRLWSRNGKKKHRVQAKGFSR